MNGVHGEELSKQLLEFQSLFVRQAYRWKRTQVSLHNPSHKSMLDEIWSSANLSEEGGKWRKIGFAVSKIINILSMIVVVVVIVIFMMILTVINDLID